MHVDLRIRLAGGVPCLASMACKLIDKLVSINWMTLEWLLYSRMANILWNFMNVPVVKKIAFLQEI